MPALTIQTDPAGPAGRNATSGGASDPPATQRRQPQQQQPREQSPTRPPVSPITPTLGPGAQASSSSSPPDFALGRPLLTHTHQPSQTNSIPPPPITAPLDFDENPDALAVKSAIGILLLQRARAESDMRSLSRTKSAALADPAGFLSDLAAGRVGTEGDPLMDPSAAVRGTTASPSSSSSPSDTSDTNSDSDSDPDRDAEEDEETKDDKIKTESSSPPPPPKGTAAAKPRGIKKKKNAKKAWSKLPKPQTIVRCPPINWAQYAVVGESLDKLHAEQVAAPTPGAPMVLGPGGAYDFNAGDGDQQQQGQQGQQGRKLVGVAAPYAPGKDKIEKKTKGKR
ncbi:hypothetical protein QBC47DRAFT_451071 [Echria macrotheca]|uniref:Uncharacterized protein n=1 Tax=Echria macrotheca TaxID=438768 RepID=A0AAJ0BI91_9PEZI|nr:hypothetical protein QBC47DRAFT_451071 [Echria macrotheca]